jgi:hypothetical protein
VVAADVFDLSFFVARKPRAGVCEENDDRGESQSDFETTIYPEAPLSVVSWLIPSVPLSISNSSLRPPEFKAQMIAT